MIFPRCSADAGLLERVISNVLSNAAAASPPGRTVQVTCRARCEAKSA